MSGWKAVRLDELEAIVWPYAPLTWRPLRSALGSRIVGMGAFTADRAGEQVVEAHRESDGGMGHEEIYVVLRGRATFTLDGAELDAPAGTFVRVEPHVHRRAVAAEDGTAVVALGGPPTFEPSSSEWIERARPHIRSDPERARGIVDDLRAERPDSPGLPIAEALLAVGRGDPDAATEALSRVDPRYREALGADPDLGPLLR
ncbi:MAG TPA: cupin domain-containing protein [Solirubrobacteraceae bacterium]|nr:cupin domain-containing protein [Solirubrobacteraceae bacterium]